MDSHDHSTSCSCTNRQLLPPGFTTFVMTPSLHPFFLRTLLSLQRRCFFYVFLPLLFSFLPQEDVEREGRKFANRPLFDLFLSCFWVFPPFFTKETVTAEAQHLTSLPSNLAPGASTRYSAMNVAIHGPRLTPPPPPASFPLLGGSSLL